MKCDPVSRKALADCLSNFPNIKVDNVFNDAIGTAFKNVMSSLEGRHIEMMTAIDQRLND